MPPVLQRFKVRKRVPLPPQPDLDLAPFAWGTVDAPVACLLIHGFSGSPAEMHGLGAYLAERGVRVEGVRLAGHGTEPEHLKYLTWHDWLQTAEEGLARLKQSNRRVVVLGFSMGGLLGAQLCLAHPDAVDGLITIATPIYFRDRRIHLIPMVRHVVRWHNVKRSSGNTDPDAHTRFVSYRRYPLIAVDHLLDLMRVTRKILPKIETPALIMHGLRDRVIHPRSARYIFNHINSEEKELVWWRNSGHGVVFDVERTEVWQKVWQFVMGEM